MNKAFDLTDDEWQRAEALAQVLARDVDRNEFAKIVTYMRRIEDPRRVQVLLQRLPDSSFIRSQRTRGYLERIGNAWAKYLKGLNYERALLVANWAFRLMTYYQKDSSYFKGKRRV